MAPTKPDLLLPGESLRGLASVDLGRCEIKSGTSFSVPIAAGAIALALSAVE